MPRDYIQRSPAKRKKQGNSASPKKPSPTHSKKPAPILMLIAVMILVVGFGYFLFSIKGAAPEQAALNTKADIKPQPSPQSTQAVLPPKPKEQWSYIKELENKTIEVDLPDTQKRTKPYIMQCASFRSMAQAEELKARIAFQGLSSDILRKEGSSGLWYQVVLGPYENKRAAEKDRDLLQRDNIQGCQIW